MSKSSKSNKPARPFVAITVREGDVVEAVVAKVKHPQPGILLVIPGNPMAFLPNSTLVGKTAADKQMRRDALLASPGEKVRVQVIETRDAGHDPANPEKQRLIVNESKPAQAARQAQFLERQAQAEARASARTEATRDAVAALVVGSVVQGTVVHIAEKDSDRNPGQKHQFGAYVEVGGVSGLLHNRHMVAPVKVGDKVDVLIEAAEMDGSRPRISLNAVKGAEEMQARALLDMLAPGQKTNGRDLRRANVGNVDGFTMKVGDVGIPAFLPADDACVKNLDSLMSGPRTARVIVTGEVIEGRYALVTRQGL